MCCVDVGFFKSKKIVAEKSRDLNKTKERRKNYNTSTSNSCFFNISWKTKRNYVIYFHCNQFIYWTVIVN